MKNFLRYLFASIFGLVVVLLMLVAKGTFGQTDVLTVYKDLCDAFSVPGLLMVCFGALVFASNGGVFDMLKFGVIKLLDLFKRDLTKVKYRTYYDYRKAMEGKEKSFAYILLVGAALTAVGVIFLLLYEGALK